MNTAESLDGLEQEARQVASMCNNGMLDRKRQEVMRLSYQEAISEEQRDKLLAILVPSACGG